MSLYLQLCVPMICLLSLVSLLVVNNCEAVWWKIKNKDGASSSRSGESESRASYDKELGQQVIDTFHNAAGSEVVGRLMSLKTCVEASERRKSAHSEIPGSSLRDGIINRLNAVMGTFYAGPDNPDQYAFEETYQIQIMNPCLQADIYLSYWWESNKHGNFIMPHYHGDMLHAANICKNILSHQSESFIAELYRRYIEKYEMAYRGEADRRGFFAGRISLMLNLTIGYDARCVLVDLLKSVRDNCSSEERNSLVHEVPREALIKAIGQLFVFKKAPEERFATMFQDEIVSPCALVHNMLSVWWQNNHRGVPRHGDEIFHLEMAKMCEMIKTESDGLTNDSYREFLEKRAPTAG